jgi:hypothetical protein
VQIIRRAQNVTLNTKVYCRIRRDGNYAAFIDEINFGSHLICYADSKRANPENINTYRCLLCILVACVNA